MKTLTYHPVIFDNVEHDGDEEWAIRVNTEKALSTKSYEGKDFYLADYTTTEELVTAMRAFFAKHFDDQNPQFIFDDCEGMPVHLFLKGADWKHIPHGLVELYHLTRDDASFNCDAFNAWLADWWRIDSNELLRQTPQQLADRFDQEYLGEYDNPRDFLDCNIEVDIPDYLRRFFDYDGYAESLFDFDGDYWYRIVRGDEYNPEKIQVFATNN